MIDLIGIITISFVFLIILLIILRYPDISRIILVAFFIRILFLIINNYIFFLPDADMDAKNFEALAWNRSQDGFINVFKYYNGPDTYFISTMLAIPYSLFGRSVLMLQSLSILLGILSVYLGWILSKKVWDSETATKVGWTLALFPSLVSYSVIVMREPYIVFLLILATYGIVCWFREDSKIKSIFFVFFGFIGATFFHGASIIGLAIFLFVISLESIKSSFKLIMNGKVNLRNLIIIFISLSLVGMFSLNKIKIPYIKNIDHSTNINIIKDTINFKVKGDAAYPEWTKVGYKYELIYKIPLRVIYFLFSPFPWDIKKLDHLIGLLDSLLYMTLVFLIALNFKIIWKDPALRAIFLMLVCYFIVFGVGVSNFGTGIRHRLKFVFGLILLAAPLIPTITIVNKKNTKKYNNL